MKPIKSQKEADKIFKGLVNIAISTLNISQEQAEKRISALLDSGILDKGSPDNPDSQKLIDKFMTTPI